MGARVWLAALALASTPCVALAEGGNLSMGVTAGVGGFYFPEMTSGVSASNTTAFDSGFDASTLGPSLALSGSVALDPFNGLDAAIGWSGFATLGHIGYSGTETFTGPGVVVIPGMTLPGNSTISLTTSSGGGVAAANSTITNNNPEGGFSNTIVNQPAGGGVNNIAAVTPSAGNDSFTYGGVVTDGAGNSAASYAAIGASDGGIFIGAGDLTGLKISTDFSMDVVYTGADVSLSLSGIVNERTAVQVYAGPSYRYLSQSGESRFSVDIPEKAPSAITFPEFVMEGNGELKSHYIGGIVGANVSYIVGPNLIFTLGGEGGLYYVKDRMTGSETYTVQGGNNGLGPYPTQTVANSGISVEGDGVAWAGRLNGVFTVALAPARQLSFGGSVEYLSRVASLRGSPALDSNTYTAGSDDGSLTWSNGGGGPSISYGSMWNFTGTISLTGQF